MSIVPSIVEALPALMWVARLDAVGTCNVRTGTAVEHIAGGIVAGAWSGPFGSGGPHLADTSIGTGLLWEGDSLMAFCGNAGSDAIFVHRGTGGLTIANSLPLVLAASGDRLKSGYAFYTQDLMTMSLGALRYRRAIPTAMGCIEPYYRSIRIGRDLSCAVVDTPPAPAFSDFGSYRALVLQGLARVIENARDPARAIRYEPIVSLSSGYDSTAAAVIAREAGCREGYSFREATFAAPGTSDSGEAAGRRLGLDMHGLATLGYRDRTDLPEVEFLAAGYGGPEVHLVSAEALLKRRLVISAFSGDKIWSRAAGERRPITTPWYGGGLSRMVFLQRLPALAIDLPAIAAGDPARIGALSRSADMQAWSIGGDYDRPIPRRIAEQAGLPRGSFANRKLLASPMADSTGRSNPSIADYLTPSSLPAFEAWLAKERPYSPQWASLRNRAAGLLWNTIAHRRIRALAERAQLEWPPAPRLWARLRSKVRPNGFLIHWAMELYVARLRACIDDFPAAEQ